MTDAEKRPLLPQDRTRLSAFTPASVKQRRTPQNNRTSRAPMTIFYLTVAFSLFGFALIGLAHGDLFVVFTNFSLVQELAFWAVVGSLALAIGLERLRD